MGRAYSCWMLNCWCITWPVGFKRLIVRSFVNYTLYYYVWVILWLKVTVEISRVVFPSSCHSVGELSVLRVDAYIITGQVTYVERNIEARSCNHCWCGKAINITYSERVFVTVGMQHAMRMCHVVICGLPGCAVFSTLSHKRRDCRKWVIAHKMCVLILSATLIWNITHSEKNLAN